MGKRIYYEKLKREDKFSNENRLELMFDLINSFRIVKNPADTADFLQDLLTSKEIKNLSIRLRIAKLLLKGKTHEEITKLLHCSFGTVAKVNAWLSSEGKGFKNVISKLPIKYNFPKNLPPIPLEFHLPQVLLTLTQYGLAKRQNLQIENFMEGVSSKSQIDKSIKEDLSEYYSKQHKNRKQF